MGDRAGTARRNATLVVLAKAPIPGFAKTRLIPRLGADGAAELHAILLERTLRTALASGFGSLALWGTPGESSPFFAGLSAAAAFDRRDQPAGDLGARMLAAVEAYLGAGPVMLVGTDCPELAPGHLERARAALDGGADAVLLPAEDGGYAALGLARVDPSLFEGVRWGSPEVMAATRERIRRLGWTAHELSPCVRDVDVPADVEWLLESGLLTDAERARMAPYVR
jgi:uncharacterized protein